MYNQETADAVCKLLIDGKSLRAACRELDLAPPTILLWTKSNKEFAEQYARAREIGYHLLADEIIEISDEADVEVVTQNGKEELDLSATAISRNRLRVDSRKWMLSKMLPKIYGEKLGIDHGIQPDNPIMELFNQIKNTPFRPKE